MITKKMLDDLLEKIKKLPYELKLQVLKNNESDAAENLFSRRQNIREVKGLLEVAEKDEKDVEDYLLLVRQKIKEIQLEALRHLDEEWKG